MSSGAYLGCWLSCLPFLYISVDARGVNLLVRCEMDLEWERLVGLLLHEYSLGSLDS